MGFRGKGLFWAVAALVAIVDLSTKTLIFDSLGVDPHEWTPRVAHEHRQNVIGEQVQFVAQMNPGMMWGMLQGYSGWLRIFRFLALGVILFLLWETDPRHKLSLVTLGAILGGAIGNIYDSIRYGAVRDFMHVDLGFRPANPWPAFNVADSAICVGVIALALTMLYRSPAAGKPAHDARAK